LTAYLANTTGPVPSVLDLHIDHELVGSSSDPCINGHLRYPNDLDGSLNEAAPDTIRQYRTDYNNRPSIVISFMSSVAGTSGRLHSEFVRLLFKFYRLIGKLTLFLQLQEFSFDGAPIASRSHTHPSHSQTSRLLTSSLPLGVPVHRATQCM
jgi:hypothetical protein